MNCTSQQRLKQETFQSFSINQQQSKFKEYLQQKVKKIQQTKLKTINMTEKYFMEIKEKMDKFLAKEQKKILNSYEDNINVSINCMNHNYLYEYQTIWFKNGKTQRKPSKQISLIESQQKPRKQSVENQNQLTIKIQVKKLLEQMILAETHLNQTVKLIGQDLKSQLHKVLIPLSELFSKIPKLAQLNENSSTLLIKNVVNTCQKKKAKNSGKSKKNEYLAVKNPQISVQKLRFEKIKYDGDVNVLQKITQKLLNKSNIKNNHDIEQLQISEKVVRLKLIPQKQDKITGLLNKNSKHKNLIQFDMINRKSIFHVYRKQIISEQKILLNQQQRVRNEQQRLGNQIPQQDNSKKYRYEVMLNDKNIFFDENRNECDYEGYCKIQFEQKPQREYLCVLVSKLINMSINQNIRKYKSYRIYIYNYKGDLITRDVVNSLRVLQQQMVIKILQLSIIREYIYVILNNHVKRYSLKNKNDERSRLFSIEQKIIDCEINEDKLILYQGRKKQLYLLNSDLVLLQVFNWNSMYPIQVQFNKLINIKVHYHQLQHINWLQSDINNNKNINNINMNNNNINSNNINNIINEEITIIIPRLSVDRLYYIEGGFTKCIQLKIIEQTIPKQNKNINLQQIKYIYQIHYGLYLILSQRYHISKPKIDIFLLSFISSNITNNHITKSNHYQNYQHNYQYNNNQNNNNQNNNNQNSNQYYHNSINQTHEFKQNNLKANISYLQTINQDIISSKFILNQLYSKLKSNKIISYNLC